MTGPQLTDVRLRLLLSGALALAALIGAVFLEAVGPGAPDWLTVVVGAGAGYAFGHAQVNGLGLRR